MRKTFTESTVEPNLGYQMISKITNIESSIDEDLQVC